MIPGHRGRSYRRKMDLPPRRTVALVSVTRLRVAGLGALASPVHAAAVINPADQPTIQAAVAAAASGDTILIAPGTYTGGVWVQDKVLTFASWYQTTGNPSFRRLPAEPADQRGLQRRAPGGECRRDRFVGGRRSAAGR
jgi:hypothetical protein